MRLRYATPSDADFLLALRNDPATRANSERTDAVDPATHAAWLSQTLCDPHTTLYVAESESGKPVGTGRLNFFAGIVEISLTVAPDARGRGIGKQLIACLVDQARRDGRAKTATAVIKSHNVASLRAFLSNGFVPDSTVRLELPIDTEE